MLLVASYAQYVANTPTLLPFPLQTTPSWCGIASACPCHGSSSRSFAIGEQCAAGRVAAASGQLHGKHSGVQAQGRLVCPQERFSAALYMFSALQDLRLQGSRHYSPKHQDAVKVSVLMCVIAFMAWLISMSHCLFRT